MPEGHEGLDGARGHTFSRLLVVVDDTQDGRRAVDFAETWSRAMGAQVRYVELESSAAAGARNRSVVAAVVGAASDFGADVIVLGCQPRRLAHRRQGVSLRARLTSASDLPILVLSPAHSRDREDVRRGSAGGTAPGDHTASVVARV